MGPGKDNGETRGIMDPPMFEPDYDLQFYRQELDTWVDLIKTAAEKGSDTLYKTVHATLARQLYDRGLQRAQKSVVDEAQDRVEIVYKQEDQVRAVQEIVDPIAVDPPIAVVSRLINSFNKVTNCQRKNSEDLKSFVSRFRGFAANHLLRAEAASATQIGEVLAITLLSKAMLPEATLTQAKLSLIALAEARKKDAVEESFSVPRDDITTILETSARIAKLASVIKVYKKNERKSLRQKLLLVRQELNKATESPEAARFRLVQQRDKRKEKSAVTSITSSGPRCVLQLDDAVSVILSLADTTKKGDVQEAMTKNQMQTAVSKEVRSFFTNHHVMNTVKQTGASSKNVSNKNTQTLPVTID